jgi:hypothetical protein
MSPSLYPRAVVLRVTATPHQSPRWSAGNRVDCDFTDPKLSCQPWLGMAWILEVIDHCSVEMETSDMDRCNP